MKVVCFFFLAGVFTFTMMVNSVLGLPLELCSDVCALNFTLNCATNDTCLKAFSNSCDLDFHNCINDQQFRIVDVEYCKSYVYLICSEDDQLIISSFL